MRRKSGSDRPAFAGLLRQTWSEARSPLQAASWFGQYVAFRAWSTLINWFPIEWNLRTAALLGRCWWWLSPRHRAKALENLRPSLGERYSEAELRRIARCSFEHFAQVYLIELIQTPQLVNLWSWSRYIELRDLGPALRMLLERRPAILITPHFGNIELLGYTIARLGLPLTAIMRPLDNPLLNDFLMRSRQVVGLNLVFKHGAAAQFDEVLGSGGALCFIADQDAGKKGVFADFFGRKASWYKAIGLVAMRYDAPIVVGYAARIGRGFRYRIALECVIEPAQWQSQPAPLQWITDTFASAMEASIRRFPEQYLWVHRRWKTRPREEAPVPGPR